MLDLCVSCVYCVCLCVCVFVCLCIVCIVYCVLCIVVLCIVCYAGILCILCLLYPVYIIYCVFCIFAVSRSFGHILKQFLILTGNPEAWQAISSYSGSVNTVSFMLVSLITLFFNQSWRINEKILTGRKKLEDTHVQLMDLKLRCGKVIWCHHLILFI